MVGLLTANPHTAPLMLLGHLTAQPMASTRMSKLNHGTTLRIAQMRVHLQRLILSKLTLMNYMTELQQNKRFPFHFLLVSLFQKIYIKFV